MGDVEQLAEVRQVLLEQGFLSDESCQALDGLFARLPDEDLRQLNDVLEDASYARRPLRSERAS